MCGPHQYVIHCAALVNSVHHNRKNTVTFLFTILCTVLTTRLKYSTLILVCVLVNP